MNWDPAATPVEHSRALGRLERDMNWSPPCPKCAEPMYAEPATSDGGGARFAKRWSCPDGCMSVRYEEPEPYDMEDER